MRRTLNGLILGSALITLGGCSAPESVDLLLHNGKIVTVDEAFSIQQAVAVRDGRIVEVGGNDLLSRYDAAQVIDLEGKTVLPGFNDTHLHMRGNPLRQIDLTETFSIAQMQEQVRAKVAQIGEGEWVTGYGWAEEAFAEQRMPTRADLDAAAPRSPVMLTRAGGHSAVVNSLAFELADITNDSPNPERGILEKDERGELNGVIRERQDVVGSLVPTATREETRPSFVQNLRDLLELGITSFAHAGVSTSGFEEWETVYGEYGEELPRANVQIRWSGRDRMDEWGRKTGDGDERLRVGAVKVFVDGGFTGPSAYTIDEYKSEPGFHGSLDIDPEELRTIVHDAHEMGWQMGFHAIGDAAIQLIVNDFAEALEASPRENHRHYLNHFTVRPPPEVMELMAEHDILITQQPNFTYTLEARYVDNLQDVHAAHNNPLRSPMDHGVFVALSSDILPIGPMVGIYAAVTRKGVSGAVYAPEERLTMEEAIIGYTRNGAYITFEEDLKGTLESGMLADMIVLSDDLLTIDPERILDVVVELTIVGAGWSLSASMVPVEPQEVSTERPQLKRAISGLGFFSLAFGSMIGVGWITALGGWFEQAGPVGAILAFVAGGTLMLVIGLCYAEVTPMLPVTGGEVAYAYKAYGTSQAFVIGWFLAFGYLSVSAFEAISVGLVLSFLFPQIDVFPLYEIAGSTVYASHVVLALVFTGFITVINYFGVGIASRVQIVLTALFLLCAALFVVSGIATGEIGNLVPYFGDSALGSGGLGGILAVFVTVPFWYVGFDTIPQAAEERREDSPLHRLGLYVVLAIIGSTVFYIAVILGAGMAGPWRDIIGEDLPTAAAFSSAFESQLLVRLVLVAGLIGLITSWNGFFLAGSRVLFSLGRGRIIHESFGQTHIKYGTPAKAVLFSGLVTFLSACLGRGAIVAFVDVGSFCIALAFLGVSLSLIQLRKAFPDLERPYRMPGGNALAYVAAAGSLFILCVMLVPGSPSRLVWPLEWFILGTLSFTGIGFWYAARGYRRRVTEEDRAQLILEDYAS